MPRLEKSGYKKFWELRELVGHNPDGSKRSVEGFRNMETGEFHTSEKGWDGRPPELPSGEKEPILSGRYARNFDKIKWNKCKTLYAINS